MNLRNSLLPLLALLIVSCNSHKPTEYKTETPLKEVLENKFLIGAAVNTTQTSGNDLKGDSLIKRHFNTIVAENCMKSEVIHPEENRYDFTLADEFVDYGEENNMFIIGHCLIWHSQLSPWFCVDSLGNNVSAEVLKQRMKDHIYTIVGRYKDRIHGWDVVNEAILDNGEYRNSKFYEILGEEYIPLAFQYTHEADPNAELYLNDYSMFKPEKRDRAIKIINDLKKNGQRIDAIGMQGHYTMGGPTVEEAEESIVEFGKTGVKVMFTEFDMSILPRNSEGADISAREDGRDAVNPYHESLPADISKQWNAWMKSFFDMLMKHSDVISRVNMWGVTDGDSWLNNWPINGRKDYPLLFDRDYQAKPFIQELLSPNIAVFDEFIYEVPSPSGEGEIVDSILRNPILPGCYPDPSICRVGDDYYMVNSSFAYFPGVPIWHSTDLKSWKQLGYVLNRPSQLPMREGLRISGGIYAPDIKYNPHNKLFYMITTNVDGGGNFFVTTEDPKKGNWSDPIYLPEVGGIDPGLFFGEDGKAYIVNNDAPKGKAEYDGHRAIWIREFDWANNQTIGEQKMIIDGGVDKSEKPVWIEGPHLYYINNTYYLMAAEGGTGTNHREVIFSSDSPFGPFKPCKINPILTQKGLADDRSNPVTCVGHADLVETPDGDWYAVFLGVRPFYDGHDVMGRETFMLPVTWENGQPIILPNGETISYQVTPVKPTQLWDKDELALEAFFIRTPVIDQYKIDHNGKLLLSASSSTLNAKKQPAAIGRWVTENTFTAETSLEFTPETPDDMAGLILFQNDECNIQFGKTLNINGTPSISLNVYSLGVLKETTTLTLASGDFNKKIYLKVSGSEAVNYTFSYSTDPAKGWITVGNPVSAALLSTRTAGGFTGTMVGIYATASYI